MKRYVGVIFLLSLFAGLSYGYDLKWRSHVEFSPASPTDGVFVTFKCHLKSGGGPSDDIKVDLRVDGVKITQSLIGHLDTDQRIWVMLKWKAKQGTHKVDMVIDPDDTIPGENPSNNVKSTTIIVGGSTTPPPSIGKLDLIWKESVSYTPGAPKAGQAITFSAKVKAKKTEANNVRISFRINGVEIDHKVFSNIPAGQSRDVSFTCGGRKGDHIVSLVISQIAGDPEENLSNNTTSKPYNVGPADPGTKPGLFTGKRKKHIFKQTLKQHFPVLISDETNCPEYENKLPDLTVKILGTSRHHMHANLAYIVYEVENKGLKCLKSFSYKIIDTRGSHTQAHYIPPASGKIYALTALSKRSLQTPIDMNNYSVFEICRSEYSASPKKCTKLMIIVDHNGEITESNEGNNTAGPAEIIW